MTKKAMITGASRGLGKEYALQLAQKGYDLLLIARNDERLKKLQAEIIEQYSVSVIAMRADLTQEQDVIKIIDLMQQHTVDLLINNAGFGTSGLFVQNEIEKCMQMVQLQIDAITRLCHACLPGMIERNYGDIINVGSTIAFMTQRYNVIYAATKYYLTGFGSALNRELEGKDVFIQTLFPGLTRTEFYDTPELAPARLSIKIPDKFWMQATDVVRISLRALNYHKKFVVPGFRNKLFILAYQVSDYWKIWARGSKKKRSRLSIE
jgi:uncharacterized protein